MPSPDFFRESPKVSRQAGKDNDPSQGSEGAMTRIRVLLPIPLAGPLDYAAPLPPPSPPPLVGSFVRVPLSGKVRIGVVWDDNDDFPTTGKHIADDKLRPIGEVLDVAPLVEAQRRFIAWVAEYTLSAPGQVLKMAMSVPAALGPQPTKTRYTTGGPPPDRMTPAREGLLIQIEGLPPKSVHELAEIGEVSDGVVRGLVKSGTLLPVEMVVDSPFPSPDPKHPGPDLSEEQTAAAATLRAMVEAASFQAVLLEGVTGSGKTEVYFEAIAEALSEPDAQILVLLPEIALTAQWLGRFEARFGVRPAEWHSDLSVTQRRRTWQAVANCSARVIVGARSALFLPFQNLRLIVVDEEHDQSFKQEEGVLYHARDMAVVRAKLGNLPIILATATPSFETLANVQAGKYQRVHLPERFGGARMPDIEIVDLREHAPPAGRWLSPVLERAVADTLARGEQTLLFLNRRGYAPLTLCRTCGERIVCPNCTAWLVEHRYRSELLCHHCGHRERVPEACPSCRTPHSLATCGPGVERLEEEIRTFFPEARLLVMASDTMAGPEATAEQIFRIERGEVDIIVGTQIITKGYHFPNLTLVGVVDADLGLRGSDLRAAERTYQQLSQVAGRAGRAEKPGRVLMQTFMPEHPVVGALASGDVDAFTERELGLRRDATMPPFGRLAAVILSGRDPGQVSEVARNLARAAPGPQSGALVLGPAPAPLARLRGYHRQRFLVKAARAFPLQDLIRQWLARSGSTKGVRVKVDIDPHNFL